MNLYFIPIHGVMPWNKTVKQIDIEIYNRHYHDDGSLVALTKLLT
jgi:hypothetical protein